MVIGFDGSRAFVEKRTGTENYSYQLLKAFSRIDRKNEYIIYHRPLYNLGTAVQQMYEFPKNFRLISITLPRLWTQVGLARQTFKDKLDILFTPAHTSPLIHRKGLKTVVTVHDLGAEYLPKMHQLKQRLYLKWITRYQLRSVTKLIAVSYATKDDLVKKVGIDPGRIEVIYEGYDKELFKPVEGDILIDSLKYYDLVPGNYFLLVSTIQPRKNLERLIKAFASLRGALATKQSNSLKRLLASLSRRSGPRPFGDRNDGLKLVIVGSKGWLSDDIYKLPKKLGIENKVKFLGHVEDKYLPALYSGAIALTYCSLFEGFGLPILEAQASGCPVLTSNVSSMPEVAGKGALYVNPYDTEDIIRGMKEIRGIRGKFIKAGFENVKRFSWEKCALQTLKVFENV